MERKSLEKKEIKIMKKSSGSNVFNFFKNHSELFYNFMNYLEKYFYYLANKLACY